MRPGFFRSGINDSLFAILIPLATVCRSTNAGKSDG